MKVATNYNYYLGLMGGGVRIDIKRYNFLIILYRVYSEYEYRCHNNHSNGYYVFCNCSSGNIFITE